MEGETIARITQVRLVGAGEQLVDIDLADGKVAAITPTGTSPSPGDELAGDGAWAMPGLWDQHVHFAQWANTFTAVDLSPATSAAHCAKLLAKAALATPPTPGGALVGMNYQGVLWDPAPSVALLDEHTGNIPVVGISMDYHSAWMNTAALDLLGLARRDGVVQEAEWFDAIPHLEALPQTDADAGLRQAQADAASKGIVGVRDFDFSAAHLSWPERSARGLQSLRVQAGFYPGELAGVIERGWHTGMQLDAAGLVHLGPLKVIADGSLNTRTAYCFHPYPQGGTGVLSVDGEALTELLTTATAHGCSAAIHAIGDRANAVVLDAFAASGARGSIEHAQLLRESEVRQMAALDLIASIQPAHLLDDRKAAEALWPGRTPYAFADLHQAGVRLALGSDAPVAALDPWLAISAAVSRQLPGEQPWHADQLLRPEVALRASIAPAMSPNPPTDGALLRPAMPADIALLATDPLHPAGADVCAQAASLRAMQVRATLLGGQVTYLAG